MRVLHARARVSALIKFIRQEITFDIVNFQRWANARVKEETSKENKWQCENNDDEKRKNVRVRVNFRAVSGFRDVPKIYLFFSLLLNIEHAEICRWHFFLFCVYDWQYKVGFRSLFSFFFLLFGILNSLNFFVHTHSKGIQKRQQQQQQ